MSTEVVVNVPSAYQAALPLVMDTLWLPRGATSPLCTNNLGSTVAVDPATGALLSQMGWIVSSWTNS